MSWHRKLVADLTARAATTDQISGLWLCGSAARNPDTLDRFSDVDAIMTLNGRLDLRPWLGSFGVIWASDTSTAATHWLARIVFADGRRLDLSVGDDPRRSTAVGLHRGARPATTASAALVAWDEDKDPDANAIRFLSALAVVKLGRGDRLIGSHLAVEMARMNLVQAMRLRDRDEGTRHHHSGTRRDGVADEVAKSLSHPEPLTWIRRNAALFDRLHGELNPDYQRDWAGLDALTG